MTETILPIKRTTTIEEIVEQYPQLVRPLRDHGIVCIKCGEAIWGTLEELAREKGVTDLNSVINELNAIVRTAESNPKQPGT